MNTPIPTPASVPGTEGGVERLLIACYDELRDTRIKLMLAKAESHRLNKDLVLTKAEREMYRKDSEANQAALLTAKTKHDKDLQAVKDDLSLAERKISKAKVRSRFSFGKGW